VGVAEEQVTAARLVAPADTVSAASRVTPRRDLVAVTSWTAIIAVSAVWGTMSIASGRRLFLGAPPLFARPDFSTGVGVIAAVAIAAVVIALMPRAIDRFSWQGMLWAGFALALVWAIALVFARGDGSLSRPLDAPQDFLHDLPLVAGPGELLRSFVAHIDAYATHGRAHPPGMLMLLWTLARLGLDGSGVASAMVISAGASAVPAAMIATRAVAGESVARRAAPFLALSPAAIWVATSADALTMGVCAWAVALLVVAIVKGTGRSAPAAVAGGALFGGALMLSYGMVLLAAVPAAIATALRRWRPLVIATGVSLAVLGIFAASGFSWPAGLAATRRQYLASGAFFRPYGYFLLGNIAAFAIVVGPATAVGISRIRSRAALLVLAACGAVLLADLSGMSKGEVERIWLPFAPWVLLAAGAIEGERARLWLAVQVVTTILVTIILRTPW
jgi:hypothetical protein